MEQEHIDGLLQRYLGLLDEYARLRGELSKLQSGVYQNIARANFSGERGMRYGQDQYDQRMQALRLLSVDLGAANVPYFAVKTPEGEETAEKRPSDGSADAEGEDDAEADKKTDKPKTPSNPLRWFGLLAPMPLRTAQQHSVEAVEQVIPRLVSVNAEMLHVEIEVRRARKRRAKAEDSVKKQKLQQHDNAAEGPAADAQAREPPIAET